MELPIDHRCEFAFLSSEDKDETCRRMSPCLSFLARFWRQQDIGCRIDEVLFFEEARCVALIMCSYLLEEK